MFAIVRTSGKQYKVTEGLKIKVNRLDAAENAAIDLGPVLLVGDDKTTKIGSPIVEGAKVSAKVLSHARDAKIIVFKKKRRQGYKRKNGHRQDITFLQITSITAPGLSAAPKKVVAPAEAPKPKAAKKLAPSEK